MVGDRSSDALDRPAAHPAAQAHDAAGSDEGDLRDMSGDGAAQTCERRLDEAYGQQHGHAAEENDEESDRPHRHARPVARAEAARLGERVCPDPGRATEAAGVGFGGGPARGLGHLASHAHPAMPS